MSLTSRVPSPEERSQLSYHVTLHLSPSLAARLDAIVDSDDELDESAVVLQSLEAFLDSCEYPDEDATVEQALAPRVTLPYRGRVNATAPAKRVG